jgi:hypothetical protein
MGATPRFKTNCPEATRIYFVFHFSSVPLSKQNGDKKGA